MPQYVLGTGLSTLPGLRLAARPGFWVAPALPNAAERLLLPDNQRIRAFDFARGVVRVQLKRGFESGGLIREIDARCGDGPAGELGVLDFDREAGWFEERIVDGWCLARCPPWLPRADFAEQAFAKLDRWRERYEREVDAGDWAARGVAEASTIADGLSRAYGPEFGRRFRSAAAVLRSLVDSRTCVRVGPTHGDFQSGNVLIERGTGRVFVCDWEHVGERLWCYDRMVWQTQSRAGGDLSARWLREIDSVGRGGRTVLALFVLEELSFFGRQGLAGPFVAAPEELVTVVEHAVTFARRLT